MHLNKGQKITIYGTRPHGYSFKQEVTVAEDYSGESGKGFCIYRNDPTGKVRPMRFTHGRHNAIEEVVVEGWNRLDVDADCYHKAKGNGNLCFVGSIEEIKELLELSLNNFVYDTDDSTDPTNGKVLRSGISSDQIYSAPDKWNPDAYVKLSSTGYVNLGD